MTTAKIIPRKPNSVAISLLDIHTTTYFLQAHTMIEEHRRAKLPPGNENGEEEVDPDEL